MTTPNDAQNQVNANIVANGRGAITGPILAGVLTTIIAAISTVYLYTTSGLTGLVVGNGSSAATAIAPGTGVSAALANPVNGAGGMLTYGILGTSGATVPINNGANTESGLWTFNGGLTATAEPSLAYTFGGVPTLNNLLLTAPGTNAASAEVVATLTMSSSAGNADVLGRYKAGQQIAVGATGNSASVWGQIVSSSIESGFSGANPIGNITLELDNNNSSIAASGFGTPNTFNLFLTGYVDSAAHYNQGMICMCYAGANPLANYGIVAWDSTATLAKIADYYDQSHSPVAFSDTGTHDTGMKLYGTYSSYALDINSHVATIDGTGAANVFSMNVNAVTNGYYLGGVHTLWDDGNFININSHANAGVALQLSSGASYFNSDAITLRNSAETTTFAIFTASGIQITPTTGTPVASLCLNASNMIIKKTTAGSCI